MNNGAPPSNWQNVFQPLTASPQDVLPPLNNGQMSGDAILSLSGPSSNPAASFSTPQASKSRTIDADVSRYLDPDIEAPFAGGDVHAVMDVPEADGVGESRNDPGAFLPKHSCTAVIAHSQWLYSTSACWKRTAYSSRESPHGPADAAFINI